MQAKDIKLGVDYMLKGGRVMRAVELISIKDIGGSTTNYVAGPLVRPLQDVKNSDVYDDDPIRVPVSDVLTDSESAAAARKARLQREAEAKALREAAEAKLREAAELLAKRIGAEVAESIFGEAWESKPAVSLRAGRIYVNQEAANRLLEYLRSAE